jgi:excisionase family DNA binding protein
VTERYLTTGEAARLMHVGTQTIVRWCDDEKLHSFRTPTGQRRIRYSDIVAIMNGTQPEGETPA